MSLTEVCRTKLLNILELAFPLPLATASDEAEPEMGATASGPAHAANAESMCCFLLEAGVSFDMIKKKKK
ncbi:MAG: hypothetical protein Q8P67_20950 [archaeon]|nr:hypothetical protein [archaeon]